MAGDDCFAFVNRGYTPPWPSDAYHQNEIVIEAAPTAAGRLVRGARTVVYDGVVGPQFQAIFTAATGLSGSTTWCSCRRTSAVLPRFNHVSAMASPTLTQPGTGHEQFADAQIEVRHLVTVLRTTPRR